MTYAFGKDAPVSVDLYAIAFGETESEAARTVADLLAAGALPFSLSEGETTVSQGFGIPLTSGERHSLYLYALATDPASRGRGHLRTLLKETEIRARADGYSALCLIPESAGLADAYRRMGFSADLPAGGTAAADTPEGLSLSTAKAPPVSEPINAEECRALLGGALSPMLFDYTMKTLPHLRAVRTGNGAALVLSSDARYALATAPDESGLYQRTADHRLLVMPLDGSIPPIPEPLPR